ncbi:MAG: deoxyribonuclease IV [Bacilli bacterium]|nr:deoxyribonuclease IV [Bacilli bacterium]
MEELLIGSHVGMNGPEYYLGSVKEALSYGANTFMFYTGAPQNTYRKSLDELKIPEGRKLIKEAGLDEDKIVVHCPYIINPANFSKPDLYALSIDVLVSELARTAAFGVKMLVLHPGASVGQDREQCIVAIANAIDLALEGAHNDVKIALETMAGKGSEMGVSFEEIKAIIDHSKYPEKLGVCFDTCHTNDAGYNLFDFDNVLKEFDRIIGVDKILVVHLNDSKNPLGAHKDRHENLGYGEIGFDALNYIAHHPLLAKVPKILETPYYNEKPPYKTEIQMLKEGKYISNWRDNI